MEQWPHICGALSGSNAISTSCGYSKILSAHVVHPLLRRLRSLPQASQSCQSWISCPVVSCVYSGPRRVPFRLKAFSSRPRIRRAGSRPLPFIFRQLPTQLRVRVGHVIIAPGAGDKLAFPFFLDRFRTLLDHVQPLCPLSIKQYRLLLIEHLAAWNNTLIIDLLSCFAINLAIESSYSSTSSSYLTTMNKYQCFTS
jgi:hypothetical protein